MTATDCNPGCVFYPPGSCKRLSRACDDDECRCAQVEEHDLTAGIRPVTWHHDLTGDPTCGKHPSCILHASVHYRQPVFSSVIHDLAPVMGAD